MEDKEHSEYLVKLQINSWKEEIQYPSDSFHTVYQWCIHYLIMNFFMVPKFTPPLLCFYTSPQKFNSCLNLHTFALF